MQSHLIKVNVGLISHNEVQDLLDIINPLDVFLFLGGQMIAIDHLCIPPLDSVLQVEHSQLVVCDLDLELLLDQLNSFQDSLASPTLQNLL